MNIEKPNVFLLPFKTPEDLFVKTETIKAAYLMGQHKLKILLDESGIKYNELGEYGFSIDLDGLTKDQIEIINNRDTSFVDFVFDKLGITEIK